MTGASSGIGKGVAEGLARRGAKLILVSRSQAKLQEIADSLLSLGAQRVEVVPADLTNPDDVKRAGEAILDFIKPQAGAEQDEGLYMLVNNAGGAVFTGMSALKGNPDEWDTLMQLNVNAPMRLTRMLSEALVTAGKYGPPERAAPGQGAVIINIGSVAGVEPIGPLGVYCATKYALRAWSQSCYRELRPHNIKVTVIEPGYVDTPMVPDNSGDRARMITVRCHARPTA